MFTVEERDLVREHLLGKARGDTRILAAAEVGSLAVGEGDRWSDLDLTLAVAEDASVPEVLEDWTRALVRDLRPAFELRTDRGRPTGLRPVELDRGRHRLGVADDVGGLRSLRRGTGGAGTHVGGDGIWRELEALATTEVSLITERRSSPPPGLAGGAPGAVGENWLLPGGDDSRAQRLPDKCTVRLEAGDVLRVLTPGGGGWGPPA